MIAKSLGLHLGALVVAAALAAQAWLGDGESEEKAETFEVWGGSPEQITRLEYSSEHAKLVLAAKQDEAGRYFVAELSRDKKAPPPAHGHGPKDEEEAEEEASGEREELAFVAVDDAQELWDQLAPLQATRALGKLDPERDADFGFDKEALPVLRVEVAGHSHSLSLGDKTPGGSDRYVKTGDGEVFVVSGKISRDLESPDGRLLQRALSSWEKDDVVAVQVVTEAGKRKLARAAEDKAFWADGASPNEKDETASNWMNKFERLRIVEYIEQPKAPPSPLFVVEFQGEGGEKLGRVEVASMDEPGQDKPTFIARSPHTRWWGRVLASTAEQLAQDVAGLVQP